MSGSTFSDYYDAVVEISGVCGDTFIDWQTMPPTQQWGRIVSMLHEYGFDVVRPGGEQP